MFKFDSFQNENSVLFIVIVCRFTVTSSSDPNIFSFDLSSQFIFDLGSSY